MAKKNDSKKENISADTTSIKITRQAAEVFSEICAARGCAKIAAISRIVEWFAEQDETLQAVILRQVKTIDTLDMLEMIQLRIKRRLELSQEAVRKKAELVAEGKDLFGVKVEFVNAEESQMLEDFRKAQRQKEGGKLAAPADDLLDASAEETKAMKAKSLCHNHEVHRKSS
jgi:hypothetical protein